jgi:hypothetical protein
MWRWSWIVKKRRNFNEFQTALSDMSMQNECLYFRKYLYKKNLRTFKYFFTNSRTFKALNFCFQIQGHSRTFKFVRTLSTNERETNYLDMHAWVMIRAKFQFCKPSKNSLAHVSYREYFIYTGLRRYNCQNQRLSSLRPRNAILEPRIGTGPLRKTNI